MTTFHVADYGAAPGNTASANCAALQAAIAACDAAGGGVVYVPAGIDYGYVATAPSTHPDFAGTVSDMMVLDRGPGSSYSSPARDGWQERRFYNTPQTSPVGQHDGNGLRVIADWHPYVWIDNNADYAAKGHASRTVNDNRRASLIFGNDGHAVWQLMNGDTQGDLSEAEMNVFSIKAYNPDGSARLYPMLVNYETGNVSYGLGTTAPPAAHYFWQRTPGYPVATFHNPHSDNVEARFIGANWNASFSFEDGNFVSSTSLILLNGFVRPKDYASNARPDPVGCKKGAMIYDATLSKPIWSDGTRWRDAAGNAV